MKEAFNSIVEPFVALVIMVALAFGIVAVVSVDNAQRLKDWAFGMAPKTRIIWIVIAYLAFTYLLSQ